MSARMQDHGRPIALFHGPSSCSIACQKELRSSPKKDRQVSKHLRSSIEHARIEFGEAVDRAPATRSDIQARLFPAYDVFGIVCATTLLRALPCLPPEDWEMHKLRCASLWSFSYMSLANSKGGLAEPVHLLRV